MKAFIEFYHRGVNTDKLIPACGSDSVYVLDARHTIHNMCATARKVAKQRGYPAYRIMRGTRFTHATPTTSIIELED